MAAGSLHLDIVAGTKRADPFSKTVPEILPPSFKLQLFQINPDVEANLDGPNVEVGRQDYATSGSMGLETLKENGLDLDPPFIQLSAATYVTEKPSF